MSIYVSILCSILLFSVLIFVHELGHFMTAKAFKVRVNEFSMFMGPAIFKKQVGETLYAIRCIPVGGYCAMEGEDGDSDDPRSFQKASWWKRLIILVAGAAMNFLIGLVFFAIVFGFEQTLDKPLIQSFTETSTLSTETGLQVGDEILKIDGEKLYVCNDFTTVLFYKGGDVHDILVLRDGEKVLLDDVPVHTYTVTAEDGTEYQQYGITFTQYAPGLLDRVRYVWNFAIDNVRYVRFGLQMILTGKAGLKDMTGMVGIVDLVSEATAATENVGQAWLTILYFGGFIAVNLAVMNLLPIPALDGGRAVGLLLTTTIEAITRKKINPKYEGYIHGIGLILLLILMAVITFKDIFFIIKR